MRLDTLLFYSQVDELLVSLRNKIKALPIFAIITVIMIPLLPPPVHADATEIGSFYQYTGGSSTEPCAVIQAFNSRSNYNLCAGLAGKIYAENPQPSGSTDNYLVDLRVFAMNGTLNCDFIYDSNCLYSLVQEQYTAIGILPSSGSIGLWEDGPGPSCPTAEAPMSPSIGGVTFNLLQEAQCTAWNSSPNYNWHGWIPGPCCSPNPNLFANNGNYADFYVEIAVAKGAYFTATFSSSIDIRFNTVHGCYWCFDHHWFKMYWYLNTDPAPTACYSISLNPSSVATYPTATASSAYYITANNTCAGVVTLSAESPPNTNIWFSQWGSSTSNNQVQLVTGGTVSGYVWITTSNASPATWNGNVYAKYGSASAYASYTLTIYPTPTGGGGGGGKIT